MSVLSDKHPWSAFLSGRSSVSNDSGQSMTEFCFIAITFLFVILGVIQLAMALNAYSLVRYAAYNAARAAIVHRGELHKMQEAARLSLVATFPKHGRADHRRGFMENYLASRSADQLSALPPFHRPITYVKILNTKNIPCHKVVTFDDPEQAYLATITVQVIHHYELVIPLVNRMVYWLYRKLELGGDYAQESLDFIAKETHQKRKVGGELYDIEYRIPLIAHYTMRLQSDYYNRACPPAGAPPPARPTPPPEPPSEEPPGPDVVEFIDPTVNGIPLDWCRYYGRDCGSPAADEFCIHEGFARSVEWEGGPVLSLTYVLGDERVCSTGTSSPGCGPIVRVICER